MATTDGVVVRRTDAHRGAAALGGGLLMPRKRTVPPDTQMQDRQIATGLHDALLALHARYPTAGLGAAAAIVHGFAVRPTLTLAPRMPTGVNYTIDVSRGLANATITDDAAVAAV